MARPQVRINLAGINALMTSPEVQALIDEAGSRIATRCGSGYEYIPTGGRPHPWVARGYVQTTTVRAARSNAKNNTLLKAL